MEFIKKTSCFWFESKLLIFVTRMVFASVQVYILFLIYEIHKNGIDLYFILSYGANSCSYVFYTIISFTYITQGKTMKSIDEYIQKHFQSFYTRGDRIKRSIIKKMKLGKYISYNQLFFTVLSFISLLPIKSDRSGILYMKMIIKRAKLPYSLDFIISTHFYFVHLIAFQVTYCYTNVMLYFVLHLHLQYLLVIEDCKRLDDLEKSVENEEYHRNIERRLASILNHYQKICRYQNFLQKLFKRPLFFIIWFGLVDMMFFTYLIAELDLGPDGFLIFVVWLSIIEIAVHLVICGHIFREQKQDLCDAIMNCQWFKWSSRNKKTYQMFLYHVQQDIFLSAGGLIPFDLTFIIWFARKTVSAVAFLSTIEEMNASSSN